ncbi:hypothetical protein [Mameliella alba]|uniref:hypothetical protein n=1 Tax=Mameliella alba TaxID=561184 RepID=UPI0015519D98|nr:hypothetical protein [Mameliella alba]
MDDVERLEQALEDRIGPDAALDVMARALSATEVTEGHVQAWANGLTAVYFRFDDLYEDAGIALRAWRRAVWDDRYTEREARQHVDAGLHDLRLAHDEIVASLPDYLFHVARSQTWSDRARRIARTTSIAGEGCRPYYRALNMADMERSMARASLPYHLLDRSLLPLPEEEPGGDDLLRIFAAVLPRDPVPPRSCAAGMIVCCRNWNQPGFQRRIRWCFLSGWLQRRPGNGRRLCQSWWAGLARSTDKPATGSQPKRRGSSRPGFQSFCHCLP